MFQILFESSSNFWHQSCFIFSLALQSRYWVIETTLDYKSAEVALIHYICKMTQHIDHDHWLALNSVVSECWLQLFQSHIRGSSFPERKNSFYSGYFKILNFFTNCFYTPDPVLRFSEPWLWTIRSTLATKRGHLSRVSITAKPSSQDRKTGKTPRNRRPLPSCHRSKEMQGSSRN
jgi:hypothetical protein